MTSKPATSLLIAGAIAALAISGAIAGASPEQPHATGASEGAAATAPLGTRIGSGPSSYGTVVFGGRQRAIYYFAREKGLRSRCYGACARAWPPVLTRGRPRALGEVKQRLLGSRRRRNGRRQVTYAGRRLYYYDHDPRGQVLCHNVGEFGGLWLAVKPSGDPVT